MSNGTGNQMAAESCSVSCFRRAKAREIVSKYWFDVSQHFNANSSPDYKLLNELGCSRPSVFAFECSRMQQTYKHKGWGSSAIDNNENGIAVLNSLSALVYASVFFNFHWPFQSTCCRLRRVKICNRTNQKQFTIISIHPKNWPLKAFS